MMMIMKQIGTGNAREMEIFADEVKKDIERLGYNLEAEFEVLMEEKYGELVYSKFYEVYLAGDEATIKEFLKTVQ